MKTTPEKLTQPQYEILQSAATYLTGLIQDYGKARHEIVEVVTTRKDLAIEMCVRMKDLDMEFLQNEIARRFRAVHMSFGAKKINLKEGAAVINLTIKPEFTKSPILFAIHFFSVRLRDLILKLLMCFLVFYFILNGVVSLVSKNF